MTFRPSRVTVTDASGQVVAEYDYGEVAGALVGLIDSTPMGAEAREYTYAREFRIEPAPGRFAEFINLFGEGSDPTPKAERRAEKLLLANLTAEQAREYEALRKSFTVIATSGKHYEIYRTRTGNVYEVNPDGNWLAQYCAVLPRDVPLADQLLAQKLMLEYDEPRFLRTANLLNRREIFGDGRSEFVPPNCGRPACTERRERERRESQYTNPGCNCHMCRETRERLSRPEFLGRAPVGFLVPEEIGREIVENNRRVRGYYTGS